MTEKTIAEQLLDIDPLSKLLADPRFLKMQENGRRTREALAAKILAQNPALKDEQR